MGDGFAADGAGGFATQVLEFKVQEYPGFRAEYTLDDRNLVVHFFLPSEVTEENAGQYRDWWLNTFPLRLDQEAQAYFNAEYPRLAAKYTEEVASWWFRAQGYDHLLDPLGYLERFFERLSASLFQEEQG